MNVKVKRAGFIGFGSRKTKDGIYFAATMEIYDKGGIVFYDKTSFTECVRVYFDENYSYGNVYCVSVKGLSCDVLYRYFNGTKEYTDEYSSVFFRNGEYGDKRSSDDIFSTVLNEEAFDISDDKNPNIPYADSLFYLAHVRGLTKADPSVKHKGTFAGLKEKVSYFKDLSVTGLILMPCYEFSETEFTDLLPSPDANYRIDPLSAPTVNFWGFKDAYYFSVKSAYADSYDASTEFKDMICAYHKAGIEVLMTVYFPEKVKNDLMISVLRHYVINYHIDGFRILGENIDAARIYNDPFLKNTKIMLDDNDLGRFYSEKPLKFKNLSFYNSGFQDIARSFLKGDEDRVAFYSYLVRENNKTYQPIRFISDYCGFTVNDLVSYNFKHNEANNEGNLDGNNYNFSWNCGAEGPSKKLSINKLRLKMAKNALLLSWITQGTPVLRGGDEWLNTCFGNNNPWCQDNETGWVKYSKTKSSKEFFEFVKGLNAFRMRHKVLHQPAELKMLDYMSCKLPDISFHSESPFKMNQDPVSRSFAFLLCGDYAKQYTGKAEDSIYVIINMYWEDVKFAFPVNGREFGIYRLFCSDGSTDQTFDESAMTICGEDCYFAPERSISIFLLRKKKTSAKTTSRDKSK